MSPNWTQVATAIIAALALLGAIASLAVTRRANRRNAAYDYFKRWSASEAVEYHAKMRALLDWRADEAAAKWKEFSENDYQERLKIMLFMNFYEELGGLYNSRLVDRRVVRTYLGGAVTAYWERTERCRAEARKRDPKMFDQWEEMYAHVKVARESDGPRFYRRAWDRLTRGTRRELRRQLTAARQRTAQAAAREDELQERIETLEARVSGAPPPGDALPAPAPPGELPPEGGSELPPSGG